MEGFVCCCIYVHLFVNLCVEYLSAAVIIYIGYVGGNRRGERYRQFPGKVML